MKVVVLGGNGFIGRFVALELAKNSQIIKVDRTGENDAIALDLLNRKEVESFIINEKPDAIINCAGTVENSEAAYTINPVITFNILSTLQKNNLKTKFIICGSAGEYGIVKELPVKEDAQLSAEIDYAKSKIIEECVATHYREQGLDVTVLRIFNPIGPGMHPRFLIPGIIRQLVEIKKGEKEKLEISRLDGKRDYIDVRDIATAVGAVLEKGKNPVYNVGSGHTTTNEDLLRLIIKETKSEKPEITETMIEPEPQYASMADITRITRDTEWKPMIGLDSTITEIVKETLGVEATK